MTTKINKTLNISFYVVAAVILILSLRGLPGNPNEMDLLNKKWTDYGPFELSPERGRFALLYSIIENRSLQFTLNIARFTTPDVGFSDGKYMSLFAPGVSFIAIPGYLLGRQFGMAQVGSYAIVGLFALLNLFLIIKIAEKLGVRTNAAKIGGLLFLFGTPAYSYAVNLYQHHISTFIILLSLYVLQNWKNYKGYALIFALCGLSIAVDNPNFFFMIPIGIAAITQMVTTNRKNEASVVISANVAHLSSVLFAVIPLLLLMAFNFYSHGDHYKLSGSLKSAQAIDANGNPYDPDETVVIKTTDNPDLKKDKKDPISFFKTRSMLNGLFIHIFSPDRGTVNYAPTVLIGLWGIIISKKSGEVVVKAIVASVAMILILYSMWGDPWGGWAFGSRYLIPAYALMAIFIGFWLQKYSKNIILMAFFLAISFYSIRVNTIGAVTSSANPPKIQVLYLESLSGQEEKYTVDRNIDAVKESKLKSYLYQSTFYKYLNGWEYVWVLLYIITGLMITTIIPLYGNLSFPKNVKFRFKSSRTTGVVSKKGGNE